MLNLSELLLRNGDEIASFDDLKKAIHKEALESGEIYFNIDIEPPAFSDRPVSWYDALEMTFSSAR